MDQLSQITSITKKPRQSNIELLRIVAIFLVLVVHADFWSLGAPTIEEYQSALIPSLTRTGFEFIAIGCVNIFVAISGWYSNISGVQCIGAIFLFLVIVFCVSILIDQPRKFLWRKIAFHFN